MSKGRIVLGVVFLVLLVYFSSNLVNVLYSHHAFGVSSDKATKAENGPNQKNDQPAKIVPTTEPTQRKKDNNNNNNNNNNNEAKATPIGIVTDHCQKQPAPPECSNHHTTTNTGEGSQAQEGPVNILCHGVMVHHSCEPCLVGFKDIGNGCVSVNQKPIQQHNNHSKSYQQGYQMGCTDTEDQTNFINSGGLKHHSKQFVKGYNDAFTHGPCP